MREGKRAYLREIVSEEQATHRVLHAAAHFHEVGQDVFCRRCGALGGHPSSILITQSCTVHSAVVQKCRQGLSRRRSPKELPVTFFGDDVHRAHGEQQVETRKHIARMLYKLVELRSYPQPKNKNRQHDE